jgi:hypothetical protein
MTTACKLRVHRMLGSQLSAMDGGWFTINLLPAPRQLGQPRGQALISTDQRSLIELAPALGGSSVGQAESVCSCCRHGRYQIRALQTGRASHTKIDLVALAKVPHLLNPRERSRLLVGFSPAYLQQLSLAGCNGSTGARRQPPRKSGSGSWRTTRTMSVKPQKQRSCILVLAHLHLSSPP